MCTEELAQKLKLKRRKDSMNVGSLGGGEPHQITESVLVELRSRVADYRVMLRLYVMPRLTGSIEGVDYDPVERYPSIRKIGGKLADDWPQERPRPIDILLGQDFLWTVMHGKTVWPAEASSNRGPVVVKSPFGLILQGFEAHPEQDTTPAQAAVALDAREAPLQVPRNRPPAIVKAQDEPALEQLLREMLTLESVGITDPKYGQLKASEARAVELLEANLEFLPDQKRFRVRLPFDAQKPRLLNNRASAMQRYRSLTEHLNRNKKKAEMYKESMNKYLTAEHCQKISPSDEEADEIFYLPHHGVSKQDALGRVEKVRIVFDGSARDRLNNSLNDKLLTGPVPDADLVRIMTRFRMYPVVFNGDVSGCFNQIMCHPADQNMFRFLWSPDLSPNPDTYKFTSLIFGSKSSPWISSTCIFNLLDQHKDEDPELVELVKKSLYVDDFVISCPTVKRPSIWSKGSKRSLRRQAFA